MIPFPWEVRMGNPYRMTPEGEQVTSGEVNLSVIFQAITMERLTITDEVADEETLTKSIKRHKRRGNWREICNPCTSDNIGATEEVIMHRFHILRYILRTDIDMTSACIVIDKMVLTPRSTYTFVIDKVGYRTALSYVPHNNSTMYVRSGRL
jgi:hypothetical protein